MFGLGGPHSCGESRLSCSDCSGQVCPKCMVQCPVGNRCPKCAGKFTSHLLEVTPWIIGRTLAAALATGYVFGFFSSSSFGFYGFFILYAIGILIGNVLHRVAGHKMGPKIIATICVGIVTGAVLSPMFTRAPAMPPGMENTITEATFSTMNGTPVMGVVGNDFNSELKEVAAKQKAHRQWNQFDSAFQSKTGNNFRVKVPAKEGDVAESVWLDVSSIKGDAIDGKVISTPAKLKELKQNDILSASKNDVQDWVYSKGEAFIGGFSLGEIDAQYRAAYSQAMGSSFAVTGAINLVLFLLGVLTPIAGIIPPIRLPFSRF